MAWQLFDADHLDATITALEAVRSKDALCHFRTEILGQELADLRRGGNGCLTLPGSTIWHVTSCPVSEAAPRGSPRRRPSWLARLALETSSVSERH